jgi:uncharacterized protein (DUF433 family)
MSRSISVIHSNPDILGGVPVFVGTRVPLQNLIDYRQSERFSPVVPIREPGAGRRGAG